MTDNPLTIGIVGEGKMGTNLFYYLLDFGFKLIWICHPSANIDKIRNTFEKKIKRSYDNGLIDEKRLDFLQHHILISVDPAVLLPCDLIIEAIPEDLEVKKAFYRQIDTFVSPNCIFASNSSSIKPSELISSEERKDKFVGIHFFYPISLKNIVEFIITADTSRKTKDFVNGFLHSINRNSLLLKEKDSFILNKIFLDFQNEAFLIVREGPLTFQQIDTIVRKFFFPIGVFEFFDSVGIDTMLTSIRNYVRGYPHEDYYKPLIEKLESMIMEGKTGQKSQSGFYPYPKGNDDADTVFLTNPDLQQLIEETVRRLNFSYFSSAKRYTMQSKCASEKINNALKEYFSIEKGPFSL
jgi:3-hydroxyacyl-CoA dehydrogenase